MDTDSRFALLGHLKVSLRSTVDGSGPISTIWFYSETLIFTALHGMQTRNSNENSVCLSVC